MIDIFAGNGGLSVAGRVGIQQEARPDNVKARPTPPLDLENNMSIQNTYRKGVTKEC